MKFNRYRVSVGEDGKVLEIGCGDGCTKCKYTESHETIHLKMAKMVILTYKDGIFKIFI